MLVSGFFGRQAGVHGGSLNRLKGLTQDALSRRPEAIEVLMPVDRHAFSRTPGVLALVLKSGELREPQSRLNRVPPELYDLRINQSNLDAQ